MHTISRPGHATTLPRQRDHVFRKTTPFRHRGRGLNFFFLLVHDALLRSRVVAKLNTFRMSSRLGQIFRMKKKQVVVVAKYLEDPKLTIF